MNPPLVFLFSGQGAQYFRMGEDLYRHDAVFRDWMQRSDDILRPLIGTSLVDLLYGPDADPRRPFVETRTSFPANVAFSYCMTQALAARGIRPHAVLGYSVGEYAAAAVAEVLTFEAALVLTASIARLLEERAEPGGMLYLLGNHRLLRTPAIAAAGCYLACLNFDSHCILSGGPRALETAADALTAAGVDCGRLPIAHAFHSPLIDVAKEACPNTLETAPPTLPIHGCHAGGPVEAYSGILLWRAIRGLVRFSETLDALEAQGARRYLDVGPAGTLANFAKYHLGRAAAGRTVQIATPAGGETARLRDLEASLSSSGPTAMR